MGEVPDSLPVTEETRERLRAAGEPARPDRGPAPDRPARRRRRGHPPGRRPPPPARARAREGDPARRHDLSREALLLRLEQLEARIGRASATPPARPAAASPSAPTAPPVPPSAEPEPAGARRRRRGAPARPPLDLEHLQQLWEPVVLGGSTERSIPTGVDAPRGEAVELAGNRARDRVPADGLVPPQPRRGAEERQRCSPTCCTRSPAAASRVAFAVGAAAATPRRRRGARPSRPTRGRARVALQGHVRRPRSQRRHPGRSPMKMDMNKMLQAGAGDAGADGQGAGGARQRASSRPPRAAAW